MMREQDEWSIAVCLIGLAACIMLQSVMIRRLRSDVDFLTVVSEKALRDGRV
jgi:hypothetical protein